MIQVRRAFRMSLVQPSIKNRVIYDSMICKTKHVARALFSWVLKTSKERDKTSSLRNLLQSLVVLMVPFFKGTISIGYWKPAGFFLHGLFAVVLGLFSGKAEYVSKTHTQQQTHITKNCSAYTESDVHLKNLHPGKCLERMIEDKMRQTMVIIHRTWPDKGTYHQPVFMRSPLCPTLTIYPLFFPYSP